MMGRKTKQSARKPQQSKRKTLKAAPAVQRAAKKTAKPKHGAKR